MATNFPASNDSFTEPAAPGSTALGTPGSGSRAHTKHHTDLGDAIEAMQAEATLLVHSHDGSTPRHGQKLLQANTHQSPDTDSSTAALHHTIGVLANQGASGTHTHTQANSHNSPDTDSSTAALHHTLGTGANQAAAGNHTHEHPLTIYYTVNGTFTKASYPGLYGVEVEVIGGGGGSGSVGVTDSTHFSFSTGGGGGGYAKVFLLASNLSASESVNVGIGGAAGAAGNNSGSDGTTSAFGAFIQATGGGAGTTTAGASSTGQGTNFLRGFGGGFIGTCDIGINGEKGGVVSFISGTHFSETSGLAGGASGGPYCSVQAPGVGAYPNGFSSLGPALAQGIGGGAGGVATGTSGVAIAGGPGAPGRVIVRLIF